MSPDAQTVIGRLDATRQKWWLCSLLSGVVVVLSASLAILLVFVLADAILSLSSGALLVLFAIWAAATLALLGALGRRLLRSQRSLAATARRLEQTLPELGSDLINLVQLSEQDGSQNGFYRAAVAQATTNMRRVRFEHAAAKETRRRRFVLCMQTPRDLAEAGCVLGALVILTAVFHAAVPRWSSSVKRFLHPGSFVPAVGTVKIVKVTPGDTAVLVGSGVEIAAEAANPTGRQYDASLYVRQDGGKETRLRMLAQPGNMRFLASIPSVLEPIQYRLEIGDSQTRSYRVDVRQKPTVADVEVTYRFPSYLEREDETLVQKHGDLKAPQFTLAELKIRTSTPIDKGDVRFEDEQVRGAVGPDGQLLFVPLRLTKSGSYTIHLFNDVGHTDPEPRVNRVEVVPDAGPTVQLIKPDRESNVAPGGEVSFVVRAGDDYGLGAVRLEMKLLEPAGGESAVASIRDWTDFAAQTEAVLQHRLVLDSARFAPGQAVMVRAVAADRRSLDYDDVHLSPQETASSWHRVNVIAAQEQSAEALAELDSIRGGLWKLLERQLRTRVAAAGIPETDASTERPRLTAQVRTEQVALHKDAVSLVESMATGEDADRLAVKRALNNLTYGDMLAAVRQAEALTNLDDDADAKAPVDALMATQDRIIDVLRRLLDVARRETAELLAEMEDRPGNDLPDDVQQELRELQEKLSEFLEEQKKVIEASENLAKKPVDDFTEEEQQLLETLATTEDDWSRFMDETQSDLSKLPEQDFANPSMAEELVEVETELKMAEDALTKKAVEIAVPIEQIGLEMAEELVTNIEKWLPDTPDRERWKLEEPLSDEMKEVPMAELPGELEDLVGELMEEEEDLFDELEDASSSWADSIDAGAGWDAMDGPISNMSAKGVTGNRLPNSSEISGRSGEGRQGKASGEFVADSAVGKGGRKTPTRLTPDPYVKGQVKDTSKDPVGGATGGGKESGQGGEGLEGPVPNQPQRELERLAGRQAALRNKAERIDLQFQVLNYHHTDMKRLVEQMAAVEQDLRGGRYRNALRRRDVVLEGLGHAKRYVEGEFAIRKDRSANLPADVQKDILGSMQEASPLGWDLWNRKYFDRLSGGTSGAAPPATNQDEH